MAVYNGTLQVISFAGENLCRLTGVQMTVDVDIIETTTKESGGWFEGQSGLRKITYSGDGLVDWVEASKTNTADVLAAIVARSAFTLVFTNGVTGDTKVTQQALISSFNVDAPMEQVSTYTIEAVGTGTPTIATI